MTEALRELNERLLKANAKLIGALCVGCELAASDPHCNDIRWQEFKAICDKAIAEGLITP